MDRQERDRKAAAGNEGVSVGASAPEDTLALLRAAVLVVLTALVLYLCWRIAAPFVNALTWAFALTIACAPLRRRLLARMPRLAATLLIMALVVVVIVVPLTFFLRQLLQESHRAQVLLQGALQNGGWREAISGNRWLGPLWGWADQQMDLDQMARQLNGFVARSIAPAVVGSLRMVGQTGAALLAFFFFLRDQESIVASIGGLLPLSASETGRLFDRIASAAQATVRGRLFIGLLQGSLGGLIFAIVGIPAALFWGAVMSFLATLPFFGAPFVWLPACAILVVTGHWIKAVIIAAWGVAVINPVDNVLYPVLVGSRIGLHSLVLFLAFVGGMIAFGPTGLILGPCIVATAAGLAEIWQGRQAAAAGKAGSE
jgi:predicted PurR-regulated permease PerM